MKIYELLLSHELAYAPTIMLNPLHDFLCPILVPYIYCPINVYTLCLHILHMSMSHSCTFLVGAKFF